MNSVDAKVEKRNRPPVSCEPCRSRKLKCNRALPCNTCVKRNQPISCHYASNARRSKHSPSNRGSIAGRLNRLEDLISSLAPSGAAGRPEQEVETGHSIPNPGLTPSSLGDASSPNGTRRGSGDDLRSVTQTPDSHASYVHSGHWRSILESIQDIREEISSADDPFPNGISSKIRDSAESEASFIFGVNQPIDLQEVISSLPPHSVCSKLLPYYFNAHFMVLGIIHPAKFQQEYERFWQAPAKTTILWISLLYSLLSTAASLRLMAKPGEHDSSIPPVEALRRRAEQCLILGRYTTATAYALEAFLLHAQAGFLSQMDSSANLWFEMGTINQLAFRMGYHRDPSNLSDISAFDGEMRRRVWLNITQVDALICSHMGLPSMIPTDYCDTQLPRNLEYSDLHVDMDTLPQGRPLTDHTPIRYTIAKDFVMRVFRKVTAHTRSLNPPPLDATMALDAELREAYTRLPPTLQRRSVDASFVDPPGLILERASIELLYLKGLIVLHRRAVGGAAGSPGSRRASVEAALGVLARQADLHRAARPGGRLSDDRWMVVALTVHDFLLAAMVVCLDLSLKMRAGGRDGGDEDLAGSAEYGALLTSQQIWAENSAVSAEARTASLALELMIRKVAERSARAEEGRGPQVPSLSIEGIPTLDAGLSYAEPMSDMIDGSGALDWDLLDHFFYNTDAEMPPYLDPWEADLSMIPELPDAHHNAE